MLFPGEAALPGYSGRSAELRGEVLQQQSTGAGAAGVTAVWTQPDRGPEQFCGQ